MRTVYIQYVDYSEPGCPKPVHTVSFETDAFIEDTDQILEEAQYHFHFGSDINFWIAK